MAKTTTEPAKVVSASFFGIWNISLFYDSFMMTTPEQVNFVVVYFAEITSH